MRLHRNAKTTPRSRLLLVQRILEQGCSLDEAAEAFGISRTTARKWLRRFQAEGETGLEDRRSTPQRCPHRTAPSLVRQIGRLRQRRWTAFQIARALRLALSTVGRILRRLGLGRLPSLEPAEPVVRYQRETPGELLHLDTKKLGRIAKIGHRKTGDRRGRSRGIGWEFVHVAIDDASRIGYAEVLANERSESAVAFLRRCVRWYAARGIRLQAVMTDNGSAYLSHEFAEVCAELGLRHLRTKPYRPCTNGKAERFIQTLLREWAYAKTYHRSRYRTAALRLWLRYYNRQRPHTALGYLTPWAALRRSACTTS
jgi:transposase InsO family protein